MNTVTALPFPDLEEPTVRPAAAAAPTIAYESPLVTVYQGKAELLLPVMRTESVDLIVTDPPYAADWQSGRRTEKFEKIANDTAADRDLVKSIITECVRLVRQHRHLYVFGPKDVLEGQKVSDVVDLVWDKGTLGSGDVTSVWGPSHEPISFTVSKHRHAGKAGAPTVPTRLRRGTVLSYTRPTGRNVRHPSEKPVPLLRELIESSSRQGETVLDPFAGVLSTAVAAVLAGRKAIVVEENPKYVELGIERIKAAEDLVAAMHAL
jgi:site-specific DNA-methyltransferase (adenine-specific)